MSINFIEGQFPRSPTSSKENFEYSNNDRIFETQKLVPLGNFQESYPEYFSRPIDTTPLTQVAPILTPQSNLHCIDVANHIKDCPVCGRLHKSPAPVFMGIIIFLFIVILFLGKRFFE